MNYAQQKRILDITIALVLMIGFLPVWIIVPIMIYLDSGSPILFKHKRIGLDSKEFELYKFRSMIPNAEEILHKKNRKLLKEFGEFVEIKHAFVFSSGSIIKSSSKDLFLNILEEL